MGLAAHADFSIALAISRFADVNLGAIVLEHEQPQHRRKIGVLALFVDRRDEVRYRDLARRGDFLERIPEWIFKAHAGWMPVYFDRSFGVQPFLLPQAFHEMISGSLVARSQRQPSLRYVVPTAA